MPFDWFRAEEDTHKHWERNLWHYLLAQGRLEAAQDRSLPEATANAMVVGATVMDIILFPYVVAITLLVRALKKKRTPYRMIVLKGHV